MYSSVFNVAELSQGLDLEESFVVQLLHIFIEESQHQLEALGQALTQRDCKTFERVAHTLKGTAASLHLETVRAPAAMLEVWGREGRLEAAPPVLETLQCALRALTAFMAACLEE